MKRLLPSILLLYITTLAFAQTKQTVIKSAISYQVKNMGFATTGKFSGLQATIAFDKKHLATSSITASIDTKTIDSDNEDRDTHLKSEDFFDVEHYPKITIKSVTFAAKGGNKFDGQFDVTIKGTTKRIAMPFTYTATGKSAVFNGSFKINRLDFGIGTSSMVLSNDVTVILKVETSN